MYAGIVLNLILRCLVSDVSLFINNNIIIIILLDVIILFLSTGGHYTAPQLATPTRSQVSILVQKGYVPRPLAPRGKIFMHL